MCGENKLNVLSLFDGISCGRVALERVGVNVERYVAYEIDKWATATSEKNYEDIEHCGNVFGVNFGAYKGFDVLLGGSPCTYWSIAKSGRETTCDGEGFRLFEQYLRALDSTGVRYFLYENNYSIHQSIKEEISRRLGVEPIMINSDLVSAQVRKRCYWTNIPNVGQPADKGIKLNDILQNGAISWQDKSFCLTATYNGAEIKNTLVRHQRTMVAEPVGKSALGEYGCYEVKDNRVILNYADGRTGEFEIKLPDGCYKIRKLMPIECERLQTLPDDYTAGVSKAQRYRQIGNGWTVDVICHILKNIV